MPGPKSYTGQDCVEVHTVSSPPLVDLLITTLLDAGARAARPGEFTMRAFLAGKKDLTQAEAVLGVIEAGTDDELSQALAQLAGGMTQPLHKLRDDLLNLLADVEAGLDFTEEDIEFVGKRGLLLRLGAGLAHLTNLRKQLDNRAVSNRPFRVALVGEPNAGKSSLFNALAGKPVAIVSPIPGTTRDYVTRSVTIQGTSVELIDTAGRQRATGGIEQHAQRLGREQAEKADLVLECVVVTEW
jgi:tRNA modification GTPase